MKTTALPKPQERTYLPNEFKVSGWGKLKPYYHELLKRNINSVEELEEWILNYSELDALVSEDFAWRYIRLSVDSEDERAAELYQYAIRELSPSIAKYENLLQKKLVDSPFLEQLDKEKHEIYIRGVKNQVELFKEENVPLNTEIKMKSRAHGKIFSKMMVEIDGEEMTLQKANSCLEEPDREKREAVYYKIGNRMSEDKEELDTIFNELIQMRHQVAVNAGFNNYRDYKFKSLGRFDYSVKDCYEFHDSIQHEILPIINELHVLRKKDLKLDALRPWDLEVDVTGKAPLRPFQNIEELLQKSSTCLSLSNPYFGERLQIMEQMGHLDLDARMGKRPGGYNMPLHLTGIPFIFMNATNSIRDMRTLMHETGHAVHSFLIKDFKITDAKRLPSEVAELAAMTMELLTMDSWHVFFENEDDLRRAKIWQLSNVLLLLPWIANIDKFQHWIYTNHQHTAEERKEAWLKLLKEFSPSVISLEGIEEHLAHRWHKQLHLFEVPFYYIEYGMAQLGAIAIWKQYRENPDAAIQNYINALKLGYTKPIGEIYKTAGIEFNFSREYVSELGAFIKKELEELIF